MSKQATQADSGFRNHRVEFVREDEPGVTPADPEFHLYSDTLETAFVWSADAGIEAQRGLGDYQVQNHFTGNEDHTGSIEYHLQHFFVDDSGSPKDAAGDAMLRSSDGGVRNTHTIVDRADFDGERTYVVARGAHPNLDEISGDPGSALPIVVALEYEVKRARMFRVGQPDNESLTVKSTDASDTTQKLQLESDGASVTDEVSLNGTTEVTTEKSFDSLDAFELDSSTAGDVVITDSSGNELTRLNGADTYGDAEGDFGVPTIGSGSHADTIGTDYERFIDDYISKGGSDLAVEVRSASFTVGNNFSKNPVMGTPEQAIHVGQQDIEFSATVAGDFAHHENMTDHLTASEFDLVWEFDGGDVTFANAVLNDVGDVGPEAGSVISTMDNTFQAKDIQISSN